MPSLTASLAQLKEQSEQIHRLSAHNDRPAGPFVQALLYSPSFHSLIRDAHESEVRLFKFIGEEPSGSKKLEKRDGNTITPLKELKRGKEKDQVGVMLRTAEKLLEDYHPLPRARARVQNLLLAHEKQVERVAELERLIAEATKPKAPAQTSPTRTGSPQTAPKAAMSVEDAIKAEEAALRRLEQSIAPLRQVSPAKEWLPRPATPPRSPPLPFASRTPARTPGHIPHISNSLVNGATPRRLANPINRFSPLKLIGTPRAPAAGSSLRPAEADRTGTIFGRAVNRASSVQQPSPVLQTEKPAAALQDVFEGDETIRLVPSERPRDLEPVQTLSNERKEAEAESLPAEASPPVGTPQVRLDNSPAAGSVGEEGSHGVDLDSAAVVSGVAKIWNTIPDIMRQGVRPGTPVDETPSSSIKHLDYLSRSALPIPAPPSDASAISTQSSVDPAAAKAEAITSQTILLAHLLLLLLRSEDGVFVQDIKETMTNIAKEKRWDGAEDISTRVLYNAVGKRTVKIDRRAGRGGKVTFAA